ncbi:MAG: phage tail sheath C-terminal domain-containing protein [Methylococcales bacterium]
MARYNTPGVYVQEISTLPPSVAQVATAIPAFIGYTEKGSGVERIDTLLDYETTFGKAKSSTFDITLDNNKAVANVERKDTDAFLMHYGLSLYFRNGGGSCYIVSVGNYTSDLTKAEQAFIDGLAALEKEDEPTLIVLFDAVNLPNDKYYGLCQLALMQCNKLTDRFLIADVAPKSDTTDKKSSDDEIFRGAKGIGMQNLSYGAAYYPYLETRLNFQYLEKNVTANFYQALIDKAITVTASSSTAKLIIKTGTPTGDVDFDTKTKGTLTLTISATTAPTGIKVLSAWNTWKAANPNDLAGFEIEQNGDGSATLAATTPGFVVTESKTLEQLQTTNTSLYNQIKLKLNEQRVILPPSPAIAGIYASVDRERGVWKTPANVGVSAVLKAVAKISDSDQDGLNADPNSGKSINAIRDFTGKGTLVWGGRTLDGNSNEWRYISVRRLFITIEESTRKATSFAVFEPNDATTWLKVKAMIESYLYGLWEQGALAGSKPELAYIVNVGLGKTMSSDDILNGRMNVEIGVAAVRPAEFIYLKFSHLLQKA